MAWRCAEAGAERSADEALAILNRRARSRVFIAQQTMALAAQSGAVAALPVWIEFFKKIISDEKKKAATEGREPHFDDFEVPPNINFVEIDRKTGLLATPAKA